MTINPDKIRDVMDQVVSKLIKLLRKTGVKIDIEQDGTIFISSTEEEMNIKKRKRLLKILFVK